MPKAEAFASRRALPRGNTAEVKALIGKGTQTFDAKQMTIVPGFIDCHNHAGGDISALRGHRRQSLMRSSSSPSPASSTNSAPKPSKTPAGIWVDGYFFDDTKVKDNRQLNVHDLDQVSKEHPVVVHHRGGHTSFYNSKAFEMAEINKNTPNPPAEPSTATRTANSTAGLPTGRAAAFEQGRQAGELHRRTRRCSATATGWHTSPNSLSAMA